jgi:hypothetical protein
MIRVWIDIVGDDARFSVSVHAETLRHAVEFAANRYPDHVVGVKFPLDPDTFFSGKPTVEAGRQIDAQRPKRACAQDVAIGNPAVEQVTRPKTMILAS